MQKVTTETIDRCRAVLATHTRAEHPDVFADAHTDLARALVARAMAGDRPDVHDLDQAILSYGFAMLVRRPHTPGYGTLRATLDMVLAARLNLTPPEFRADVRAALHPAALELARPVPASILRTPPAAARDWLPVAGLYDGYAAEFGQIIDLPELMREVLPSPAVQADHRYRANLYRAAAHSPDIVHPPLRAAMLLGAVEAMAAQPGLRDQPDRHRELIALLTETVELLPGDEKAGHQLHLSGELAMLIDGDRADHLEQALGHCLAAIDGFARIGDAVMGARAQQQLGRIYRERLFGDGFGNALRAVTALQEAAKVLTRERAPRDWALVRNTMGTIYREATFPVPLPAGLAAAAFRDAASILDPADDPDAWAGVMTNLGAALDDDGDPDAAIEVLTAALAVRDRKSTPKSWAELQHNLGQAYRAQGRDLERALEHYHLALEVHAARPLDQRRTSGAIGEVYALLGNWAKAHQAFAAAWRAGEALLREVTTGTHGVDEVVRPGHQANELDAYALAKLGRTVEAVEVLERGRAYGLSTALRLLEADPAAITDGDLRARFVAARAALLEARRRIDAVPGRRLSAAATSSASSAAGAGRGPGAGSAAGVSAETRAMHRAKLAFDEVVREVVAAGHDFRLDDTTLAIGDVPDGTVYLLHTEWGGLALAVRAGDVAALELPGLTDAFTGQLIQTTLPGDDRAVVGGYGPAQEGRAVEWVAGQWAGTSLADRFRALIDRCAEAGVTTPLSEALSRALASTSLADALATPIAELVPDQYELIAALVNARHLPAELRRCLTELGTVVATPLAAWLGELGMSAATLVPCGVLPVFPFAAAPVGGDAGEWTTLGDTVAVTVAPSARRAAPTGDERDGVFALGDPRPTHQPLLWGEAEARTLAGPDRSRTGVDATRDFLLDAMRRGRVVSASCHGAFDGTDVLNSGLLLAGGERFTLADAFALHDEIRGLPLLILSACQAAVVDLRGAVGEVRGLPTGLLQAGVRAVVAPLWTVDDRATYHLMAAFAREVTGGVPPELALARAAAWLRTATNDDIAAHWPDSAPAAAKPRRGGSRPYAEPIFWASFQVYGVSTTASQTLTTVSHS
ncbi:MAG: CHAT domain-containing tetratricopeptide repeat protein [Actinoplanes sp.]